MALRASSHEADLGALTSEEVLDAGVDCGADLLRLARATLDRDHEAVAKAGHAVRTALGDLAASRAAGVIGFFDAINRVADGTGLELDSYVQIPAELDLSWIEAKRAGA